MSGSDSYLACPIFQRAKKPHLTPSTTAHCSINKNNDWCNMKESSKQKRINGTIRVLVNNRFEERNIGDWLMMINKSLGRNICYRSPKQLSKTFRFIRISMGLPLMKVDERGQSYCYEPSIEQMIEVSR